MDRRSFLKAGAALTSAGALASYIVSTRGDGRAPSGSGAGSGSSNRTAKAPGSQTVPSRAASTDPPAQSPRNYRQSFSFDQVFDAVDDLGMDPSGTDPIDDTLARTLESGTLVEFPPGEYLTTERHTVEDLRRWGIRGTGSNRQKVRIKPQRGAGHFFLNVRSGRDILVENLTFDVRDSRHEWLTNIFKLAGGLRLNDVEYAGFYASDITGRRAQADTNISGPLHVHVTDPDGHSIVDTLVRRGPTHHADYPGGHSCLFVGPAQTVGTLTLKNCHVENMSSHGMYASRTRGRIRVENCTFKNNNGAGIRISGPKSYVRDSTIVVDRSDLVSGTLGDPFNSVTSGVWFESGYRTRPGGTLERCLVTLPDAPDRTRGIEVDGSVGRTTIKDTRVHTGPGNLRPLDINEPGPDGARVSTQGGTPANPRVTIRNATVTGRSSGDEAVVDVDGREGTRIENCTIDFAGDQDGIAFKGADKFVIDGTTIDLTNDGVGVRANDSLEGTLANTTVSVPVFPVVVETTDTPTACPVTVDSRVTLNSSLWLGVRRAPSGFRIAQSETDTCLQTGEALVGGGVARVMRTNSGKIDVLVTA